MGACEWEGSVSYHFDSLRYANYWSWYGKLVMWRVHVKVERWVRG